MRFTRVFAAAAVLTAIGAVSALAQGQSAKIYAYNSGHNYCPAGLQPVTMDGTICCGRPNQNISYQQALAQPVAKKRHVRRASQSNCPVGTKGCTFD